MGCFLVPGAEAVATTIATKIIEKKENKEAVNAEAAGAEVTAKVDRFSSKLKKLNYMLYGGSGLLMFEHLWHGEVQPFFPFLTGASTQAGTVEMLQEMSTVGVTMAVAVTSVWGLMTFVSNKLRKSDTVEITE